MAIPISVDVSVTPGVLAAGGSAVDLNGVILTDNALAPQGTLLTFTSEDDVSDYFGSSSTEYSMADIYFAGYDNSLSTPGTLYFWAFNTTAVAAFLRSASLSSLSVASLKLLSGDLTLTVDNGTAVTQSLNFSSVTSYAAAAELIQDAFGSDVVTVNYDTTAKALIFTSPTTGADSAMAYASGDLATSLLLTEATGAVLSQGADAASVTDSMKALKAKTQDWATFTASFECTVAQHVTFSAWGNSSNNRFVYVGWSQDGTETTSGSTSTFAYQVIDEYSYGGTVPVYGDQTHACSAMGFAASLDFDATNGRRSLKYRAQSGLTVMATTEAQHTALTANGYNFYGKYSENNVSESYWSQGTITGDYKWYDAYLGQIWLNANLQSAILTLLMSETYLPYGTPGRTAIEAACADPLSQFKTWGGITTGTTLTSAQKQAIYNTVGSDVSSTLSNQGYYLYIGEFTATMRANRTSPAVTLWYTDGGVLQNLSMSSIEVQ